MDLGSTWTGWWVAGAVGSAVGLAVFAVAVFWWPLADFLLATGDFSLTAWLERMRLKRRRDGDDADLRSTADA